MRFKKITIIKELTKVVKTIDFILYLDFSSEHQRIIVVERLKLNIVTKIVLVISRIASVPYSPVLRKLVYKGRIINPINFELIFPKL